MVYPALLPLMRTPRLLVVDWTDAPADLNGLVRFAERRNMVSARVPSHFKRSLKHYVSWPARRWLSKHSEGVQVSPVDHRAFQATEACALSCSMSDSKRTSTSSVEVHLHSTYTSSWHGANLGQRRAFNLYHGLGSRNVNLEDILPDSLSLIPSRDCDKVAECIGQRVNTFGDQRLECDMTELLLPTQTTRNKINSEYNMQIDRSM